MYMGCGDILSLLTGKIAKRIYKFKDNPVPSFAGNHNEGATTRLYYLKAICHGNENHFGYILTLYIAKEAPYISYEIMI